MGKPKAKDWRARELSDWNVTTFHAYMIERHEELFGVPYFPFGTWSMEQRMLRGCIDTYGAEIVKRFIDEGFRTYSPTREYPGTNFGFLFKYRNEILQRVILESRRKEKDDAAMAELMESDDDDLDWI